jgi:hypothetical protein
MLWVISWRTLEGGIECVGGDNESVDVRQKGTTLYSYATFYLCLMNLPPPKMGSTNTT